MGGDMEGPGAQLRKARQAEGVSLSAVAARSHYTKGHLSNVESGRRSATPDVVLAYARALGEDCMKRRGLLAAVAASVVAPVAADELIRVGFSAALRNRGAEHEWQGGSRDTGATTWRSVPGRCRPGSPVTS
jgi:transcriptional regulator with XRE-family HTH domain